MSWLSICNAKAALAAALASGATYAGVALTTPAAPPAPVSDTGCAALNATLSTPLNSVQCTYYTDLKDAGLPIVPNAIPNIGNLCGQIKSIGPAQAAKNLAFAWSTNPKYSLTVGQAEQYVSIAQKDVCN